MAGWAACALAVAVFVLYLFWQRYARRRRAHARLARAGEGERRARAWLEELGFEIVGAQVAAEYTLKVDASDVPIAVRADYVVARGGAVYVAEVKTGALAPRVQTPATRRQLLEYAVAFDADGVLLVDAESGRVHEVAFPRRRAPARVWHIVLCAALVAIAVLWRL
jgi:hypothetical protein